MIAAAIVIIAFVVGGVLALVWVRGCAIREIKYLNTLSSEQRDRFYAEHRGMATHGVVYAMGRVDAFEEARKLRLEEYRRQQGKEVFH